MKSPNIELKVLNSEQQSPQEKYINHLNQAYIRNNLVAAPHLLIQQERPVQLPVTFEDKLLTLWLLILFAFTWIVMGFVLFQSGFIWSNPYHLLFLPGVISSVLIFILPLSDKWHRALSTFIGLSVGVLICGFIATPMIEAGGWDLFGGIAILIIGGVGCALIGDVISKRRQEENNRLQQQAQREQAIRTVGGEGNQKTPEEIAAEEKQQKQIEVLFSPKDVPDFLTNKITYKHCLKSADDKVCITQDQVSLLISDAEYDTLKDDSARSVDLSGKTSKLDLYHSPIKCRSHHLHLSAAIRYVHNFAKAFDQGNYVECNRLLTEPLWWAHCDIAKNDITGQPQPLPITNNQMFLRLFLQKVE